MKTILKLSMLVLAVAGLSAACAPERTADDKLRDQQSQLTQERVSKVGMPGIKNFRQAKAMKAIQELCDEEIVTFTYIENLIPTIVHGRTALGGKFTYLGETITYPLPYAAQFTAPESMQTFNLGKQAGLGDKRYGVERLPQADPDGLFKPSSAEATWVLLKDPSSSKVAPVYMEPKIATFPFKLPMD